MSKEKRIQIILISLLPFSLLVNSVLQRYPDFVERYYSNTSNKYLRQVLSIITGVLPFSLAEGMIIVIIMAFLLFLLALATKKLKGRIKNCILWAVACIFAAYSLFLFLWGFNYGRLPFRQIIGLRYEEESSSQSVTHRKLYNLCRDLAIEANKLRKKVKTDGDGIMTIPGGYRNVFRNAYKGYDRAARLFPEVGGKYGRPKPVIFSRVMCYTGITGIYVPFTGEANVNISIPDFTLPYTTTHEMAHQRGFAREDEANYLAYVSCIMNPSVEFKYSGTMLGLIYSMNALEENDIKAFYRLKKSLSKGVLKDLRFQRKFWSRYRGIIQKMSDKVNSLYLKSNGQKEGVKSYGEVVELLLMRHKY